MPDAHLGYGMPIGEIRRSVPVGFKHHQRPQNPALMPKPGGYSLKDLPVISREFKNASTQLGTLGGGNHFIEIQKGNDGFIWIMLHSGSRNIGFKVANYYNRLAIDLNRRWGSKIPKQWQLAFLPIDSEPGRKYISEMRYCIDFTFANRKLMVEHVRAALQKYAAPLSFGPLINIAHNYAAVENHYHQNVMIHRKGATRAQDGEIGIIPGSQGTPSYIVRGKGNNE